MSDIDSEEYGNRIVDNEVEEEYCPRHDDQSQFDENTANLKNGDLFVETLLEDEIYDDDDS